MIQRLVLGTLLYLIALSAGQAQSPTAICVTIPGTQSASCAPVTSTNPLPVSNPGTTTAAGTSGTSAQNVQGVTGGVPVTTAPQDGYKPWGNTGGSASSLAVLGPGGTPATIDTTGYQSIRAQVITFATGGFVQAQRSLDGGTTWATIVGVPEASTGGAVDGSNVSGAISATTIFPAGGLMRFNQTAWSSGTTTLVVSLHSSTAPVRSVNVAGGTVVATTANQPTTTASYQQITSLSASTALTVPGDAKRCLAIPNGQGVRWRADGTAPTATVGMPTPVGAYLSLDAAECTAARFIQQAASATLDVYYSK